jgi:hypothetical protein
MSAPGPLLGLAPWPCRSIHGRGVADHGEPPAGVAALRDLAAVPAEPRVRGLPRGRSGLASRPCRSIHGRGVAEHPCFLRNERPKRSMVKILAALRELAAVPAEPARSRSAPGPSWVWRRGPADRSTAAASRGRVNPLPALLPPWTWPPARPNPRVRGLPLAPSWVWRHGSAHRSTAAASRSRVNPLPALPPLDLA